MCIAMFKRTDYTHPDPEKDRRGVHKKTDYINWKPDGFLNFSHGNGPGSYLADFCFIEIPDMPLAEAIANDHRRSWKDDFDYEIVEARPAQGEYDIRVFEKNAGAINQNSIAGVKATKIRDYMIAWGCSNFSLSETDASFTFSLWDAVRSPNFWEVPLIASRVNFTLNAYSGATGIGNITAMAIQASWGQMSKYITPIQFATLLMAHSLEHPGYEIPIEIDGVTYVAHTPMGDVEQFYTQAEIEDSITKTITRKITDKGGTIISQVYPNFVFEIERSDILTRFRADVKRRMEQVYMRHQYCISQADHDAIVAAGGIVTMTKAEFLGKLVNKMTAV